MTTRPGERRHAEALADALDGRGPGEHELDGEVARLVRVAEALCRADVAGPRPDFVRDLRTRLMNEAPAALASARPVRRVVRVQPVTPPRRAAGLRRRLGAIAATFAIAGGSFGLVTSSASALPGEMLYPVKRGVENTQLMFERGPSAVGSAHLGLAQERLQEVEALVADGNVDARTAGLVSETLDQFSAQARQGSDSLLESYARHGHQRTVDEVTDFTRSSARSLAGLSGSLPASAGASYASASDTLGDLNARTGQACGGCVLPSLAALPTSLTSPVEDQVENLAGSTSGLSGEDDLLGSGPKNSGQSPGTQHENGTGDQASGDGHASSDGRSPADVASLPTDLPKVSAPRSTSGTKSSDQATPRPPEITEPVKKVTEPVEKLLDPVVEGLLGPDRSGDHGRRTGSGDGTGSGGPDNDGDGDSGLVPGLLGGLSGKN